MGIEVHSIWRLSYCRKCSQHITETQFGYCKVVDCRRSDGVLKLPSVLCITAVGNTKVIWLILKKLTCLVSTWIGAYQEISEMLIRLTSKYINKIPQNAMKETHSLEDKLLSSCSRNSHTNILSALVILKYGEKDIWQVSRQRSHLLTHMITVFYLDGLKIVLWNPVPIAMMWEMYCPESKG